MPTLKHEIDHSKFFRFSVGKVDEEGSKIDGGLRITDCDPILDWIQALFIKQPLKEELEKIEQKVNSAEEALRSSKSRTRQYGQQVNKHQKSRGKKTARKRNLWAPILQLLTLLNLVR